MKSEIVDRKFLETFDVSDWEIETDSGWQPIKHIGKTIEYEVWEVKTETFSIKCADNHILFDNEFKEMYAKELSVGDKIMTIYGPQKVTSVKNLGYSENMYDIEVDSNDHRYYTNGILSHNSIWLANLCANAVRLGYNSALISCEMKDRHCIKRLGANMLGISMSEYADMASDQDLIKKKLNNFSAGNGLELTVPGKLYVKEFPPSCASVKDLERWLLKMEEMKGIKFKTVFVDYINILMNWRNPNTENTYMKIKQIAEDLRAMATRNNWAVITLTQLNRAAEGASHVTLSNVAESSGLGHTVDAMFGIIQDDLMYANNEYFLQLMLNRNEGYKNSKKKFKIDYDYMRLSESSEEIIMGD